MIMVVVRGENEPVGSEDRCCNWVLMHKRVGQRIPANWIPMGVYAEWTSRIGSTLIINVEAMVSVVTENVENCVVLVFHPLGVDLVKRSNLNALREVPLKILKVQKLWG